MNEASSQSNCHAISGNAGVMVGSDGQYLICCKDEPSTLTGSYIKSKDNAFNIFVILLFPSGRWLHLKSAPSYAASPAQESSLKTDIQFSFQGSHTFTITKFQDISGHILIFSRTLKHPHELNQKVKRPGIYHIKTGFPRFHHDKIPGHFQDTSGHIITFSRTQKIPHEMK